MSKKFKDFKLYFHSVGRSPKKYISDIEGLSKIKFNLDNDEYKQKKEPITSYFMVNFPSFVSTELKEPLHNDNFSRSEKIFEGKHNSDFLKKIYWESVKLKIKYILMDEINTKYENIPIVIGTILLANDLDSSGMFDGIRVTLHLEEMDGKILPEGNIRINYAPIITSDLNNREINHVYHLYSDYLHSFEDRLNGLLTGVVNYIINYKRKDRVLENLIEISGIQKSVMNLYDDNNYRIEMHKHQDRRNKIISDKFPEFYNSFGQLNPEILIGLTENENNLVEEGIRNIIILDKLVELTEINLQSLW